MANQASFRLVSFLASAAYDVIKWAAETMEMPIASQHKLGTGIGMWSLLRGEWKFGRFVNEDFVILGNWN